MGYSYVSVMYRVCIGYVSGMYRNIRAARGIYLSTMETMIFNNGNNGNNGNNDNNNDDNNNNYALVTK